MNYDDFEEPEWELEWEPEDLFNIYEKPFKESFFSRGEPVYKLGRCIRRCPEVLQDVIAESYGLELKEGKSRKKQLEKLEKMIPERMSESLINIGLADMQLLAKLAVDECSIEEVTRGFHLQEKGLVFYYLVDKEELVIPVVPEEVTDRLSELLDDETFLVESSLRILYQKFIHGYVRLYGVFDKKMFYHDVLAYMEKAGYTLWTEEKLEEILSAMAENPERFCLKGEYVFDPDLEEDEDYVRRYKALGDKSYYSFSEEDIEFYQEEYVDVHSKAYIALMRYLRGKLNNVEDTDCLMEELAVEVVEEIGGIYSVPAIVERYEIPFSSEEDLNKFETLFRRWEDSVRKWNNRGFTNLEMQERGETGSNAKMKWNLKRMGFQEAKPHPDAPCPCGSGKRYRQCCGR